MSRAVLSRLSVTPVTLAELARATGETRRSVERAVQALRLAGHPIVTDGSGVRLAHDAGDALTCADRLRHRAIVQLLTARALRRAGQRMAATEAVREHRTLWRKGA